MSTTEYHDLPYLDALTHILVEGEMKSNRTGVDTLGVFGLRLNWDLQEGFPLLTTKKVHTKSLLWELLWFMRGDTNVKWLNDRKVRIWDEWADANGELGPIYGRQWRAWAAGLQPGGRREWIDQLATLVNTLKNNPNDRRMIVSAWNVAELEAMALPPCHMFYQCYVRDKQFVDLQIYQRSCDMFLGVPFNIASYATLVHILAHLSGYKPGRLFWVGGDCHIYENHMDQVKEQRSREPRPSPQLVLKDAPNGRDGDWDVNHFEITGYDPHPVIKADVAV